MPTAGGENCRGRGEDSIQVQNHSRTTFHAFYKVSQEQIPKKNRIIIYFLENRTAEHLSGYV
jgi:hypothetical protein